MNAQIWATISSFVVAAGGVMTAFVKQAKAAEAKVNSLVVRYEAMLNSVLSEVTKLEATINKALPQPAAPAPAKTVAKKPAPKATKKLR